MIEEPGIGRGSPGGSNDFHGLAGDGNRLAVETANARRSEVEGAGGRSDACPPEDLVRHPVADPGESLLHEKNSLDRGTAMSAEKAGYERVGESWFEDIRWSILPPGGRSLSAPQAEASEFPRVPESKGCGWCAEHKMMVAGGDERGVFQSKGTGHPKVNGKPGSAGEEKGQALSMSFRGFQNGSREMGKNRRWVGLTEDAGITGEVDLSDGLTESRGPSAPVEFDFRQFRHPGLLRGLRFPGQGQGQVQGESGSLPGSGADPDVSAHDLGDLAANG